MAHQRNHTRAHIIVHWELSYFTKAIHCNLQPLRNEAHFQEKPKRRGTCWPSGHVCPCAQSDDSWERITVHLEHTLASHSP